MKGKVLCSSYLICICGFIVVLYILSRGLYAAHTPSSPPRYLIFIPNIRSCSLLLLGALVNASLVHNIPPEVALFLILINASAIGHSCSHTVRSFRPVALRTTLGDTRSAGTPTVRSTTAVHPVRLRLRRSFGGRSHFRFHFPISYIVQHE